MYSIIPAIGKFLDQLNGGWRAAWAGISGTRFGKNAEPGEEESGAEPEVDAAVLTDIGCVRETNEDSIVFVRPETPAGLREKGYLAVVADGMGGHSSGEVASRLAVTHIPKAYYEHSGACREALEAAVKSANGEIHRAAGEDPARLGMGTTCTALALKGGKAYCTHVGDSRLYLVRNGGVYLMTEDHSVVMDMVRRGILSFDEARHHPSRNLITRSLGTNPTVETSTWQEPLRVLEGDVFILCTDGLHEYVEDEELLSHAGMANLEEACRGLIELAKRLGGEDNLSVGLVRIGPREVRQGTETPITRRG